jgi:Protein of unknown function (DUF2795)
MPDEGASMKDSPPVREDEARRRAGAEHGSRDRVQDERMPEYQIEERKRESATVIEQAAGEGQDEAADGVAHESTQPRREAVMDVSPIEVQKHLQGVDYPADKEQLVDAARRNGAEDDVVKAISSLPSRQFDGPDTVMEQLGG